MVIYLELTRAFNQGRVRAILAGGQAAVLHRLVFMSKDGDWILREDPEAMNYVLAVLAAHGARYRYGAPLDVRWLSGGWSAHLEFAWQGIRVRTDFVTRPPRIGQESLARIWREAEGREVPFATARDLAEMKKTNREKDYAVIGELARLMFDPADQLLYSRSARDLIKLREQHPALARTLAEKRPVLRATEQGREALEVALDAERRQLIRANEARLARYLVAAEAWAALWPALSHQAQGLTLPEFHRRMVAEAEGVLPQVVPGGWP